MAYKPSDFAAGFGDVVSVLFPGGVLAFVMLPPVAAFAERVGLPPITDGTARWITFVVAAYFLGHLAFMLGSLLDNIYDPLRKAVTTPDQDALYGTAQQLMVSDERAKASDMKVYKFAKAYLALKSPNAAADISRLEAESKFFRSVIVVLVLLIGMYWDRLMPSGRFWGVLAVVLAFWRYGELRWKSNAQAYTLLIVDQSGLMRRESRGSTQ